MGVTLTSWRERRWRLTSTLAVASGVVGTAATPAFGATGAAVPPTVSTGTGHTDAVQLRPGPLTPTLPTGPLPVTGGAPAPAGVSAAALPAGATVDLKVLVISRTGTEVELPAVTKTLDYLGTPYTVYNAAATPNGLTMDKLANGAHALYSGVILTDGALGVTGAQLSATEINNLTTFESTFGIRQVTWYTYPSAYYGFGASVTSVDTTTTLLPANYTAAGANVFSYVNAANPLAISKAYTYLAQPATDGASTPLLTDAAGNALALVHTYASEGNRQNLALTFDSNENLTHNLVLGYGLVSWVNGGLYLGERHSYLQPQPDDILLTDSTWPAGTVCTTSVDDPSLPTYRMTGADLQTAVTWQNKVHT